MGSDGLGKVFGDGEIIVQQGTVGDCMYVIQQGEVEILIDEDGREISLATLGEREFFGEMAVFGQEVRSATVRAQGEVRVLTVDKKNLLRRIHEDPSLAFRLVEVMSQRIRELDTELSQTQTGDRRQSPRFHVSTVVELLTGGKTLEARLCDISKSGARIKLAENLGKGQEVALRTGKHLPEIEAVVNSQFGYDTYGLQFVTPIKKHANLMDILRDQKYCPGS